MFRSLFFPGHDAVRAPRFSAGTIAALQKIRWRDWPIEGITKEKSAFDLPEWPELSSF